MGKEKNGQYLFTSVIIFGPMQLQQNQFSGRGCNSLDENEIKVKNNWEHNRKLS